MSVYRKEIKKIIALTLSEQNHLIHQYASPVFRTNPLHCCLAHYFCYLCQGWVQVMMYSSTLHESQVLVLDLPIMPDKSS